MKIVKTWNPITLTLPDVNFLTNPDPLEKVLDLSNRIKTDLYIIRREDSITVYDTQNEGCLSLAIRVPAESDLTLLADSSYNILVALSAAYLDSRYGLRREVALQFTYGIVSTIF